MIEILTDEQLAADPDQQFGAFKREKKFLVAIDTDGAVTDNMNGKQMLVFIPLAMTEWDLWGIESYYREIGEFVNLYSKTRGCNRFLALQRIFKFLKSRPEVQASLDAAGVEAPDGAALDAYLDVYAETKKWSPATINEYRLAHLDDDEVGKLWEWCFAVNDTFPRVSQKMAPFAAVPKTLEAMAAEADLAVVSQTPYRDLAEYWVAQGIETHIKIVCGQDMGSKTVHIQKLMEAGGYAPDEVFMIGDADGDRRAVKDNDGFFFPINPGQEEASWEKMLPAFEVFTTGEYAAMEKDLTAAFDKLLPEPTPWDAPDYDHATEYKKRQETRIALRDAYNPGQRLLVM